MLAENTGVTFVLIGPLGNLADLLDSEPDEISPLDGVSLVRKSVDKVVIMGGNFENTATPEFNIECDIPAAKTVAGKCPAPIVWCGFEAGLNVITGETLKDCPVDYPVRLAYEKYTDESFRRPSWDLATVLYALTPDSEDWIVSDEHKVDFADNGAVMISDGKGSRWVRHRDERALEKTLNNIIGLSD
ncbi:MAG: nucleoside hydrolase [Eubacteriales bacterium]